MNQYNTAQVDYREGCKKRLQRQMEISMYSILIPFLMLIDIRVTLHHAKELLYFAPDFYITAFLFFFVIYLFCFIRQRM